MARYTSSYIVSLPFAKIGELVVEVLTSCPLEITYNTGDYIMAKEKPGQVTFSKLVSVEILIERTTSTPKETKFTLVVNNTELPLQVDNHCYQMFQLVSQALVGCRNWQIIEPVAG
ncbi:hypothetical protein [Floridanema evergladense]|uniref:Uncharacterized protein n=1 Tax=Floridaenema evergladense BLCC-F167 TaxID=3153639 RepID=A0ABV4WYI4_9CYAN